MVQPIKILVWISVVLLLAALAACGGGASVSQSGGDGGTVLELTVVPDRLNVSDAGACSVEVVLWNVTGTLPTGTVTLTSTLGTLGATTITPVDENGDGLTATGSTTLTPKDSVTVGNAVVTARYGSIQVWVSVEFYETLGT